MRLSDPARGTQRSQLRREGRVRWSAWFRGGFVIATVIRQPDKIVLQYSGAGGTR